MMSPNEQNQKKNIHTISLRVNNQPGVLMRIASVFARRGYNIEALVVSPDVNPEYSRMTITAQGDPYTLDQIIKQTSKLIDVTHVSEHSKLDAVHSELALLKVKNVAANKPVVSRLLKKFGAKVIFEDERSIIIEQTGSTPELDELETMLRKYGLVEMVRSGKLVIAKGVSST